MAMELVRVVATVRVKSLEGEPDFDQLSADVGEYLSGTAILNIGLHPVDDQFMSHTHVHVSTESSNCNTCIAHAMDEQS